MGHTYRNHPDDDYNKKGSKKQKKRKHSGNKKTSGMQEVTSGPGAFSTISDYEDIDRYGEEVLDEDGEIIIDDLDVVGRYENVTLVRDET